MNELLRRASEDPWSLDLADRRHLAAHLHHAQEAWLPMLKELAEPPELDDRFPAFLLETAAFAELRAAIAGQNQDPSEPPRLDTATADTLQRFVDLFRRYLAQVDQKSRVNR